MALATRQTNIRLPRTVVYCAREMAEKHGCTVGAIYRRAIVVYLTEHAGYEEVKESSLP